MNNINNKGTNQRVRALDDREQARQKLPVFFGSRDTSGFHSVIETLANACDELNNNFQAGKVIVSLSNDNRTISIEDNGRGIPIEMVDEDNKPYYELLFTTLFAGSKYETDMNSFSTGTNGVGNTVICLTSLYFECVSKRNGKEYRVVYEDGGKLINGLETLGNTSEHGSKFTFKLDDTVHNDYLFNADSIRDLIDKKAGVCNKLDFEFNYKGENNKYHYNSLEEYYNKHFNSSIAFSGKAKEYVNKEGTERNIIEAVIGMGAEAKQEAYLNDTYLKEGGSLNEGIIEGCKQFINKYCKDNALYNKSEKNISNADIQDSLSFVVKTLSTSAEFCNQTKFATKKTLYRELAKEYVKDILVIMSIEKKEQFRDLVNKILISKRATEKANITRNSIRKELEKKVNNTAKDRIAKFIPCRETRPEETELYLVEGDSAAGAVAKARNKINQCLYPLKGKVLNVSKKTIDEILKNKEILDIFKILGCGMTHNGKNVKGIPVFNMNNLNMHKICILSDEDVDGSHIASLIVNMFFVLAPMLIEKGMVYRCLSPLYKITTTKDEKVYYAYDEEEKNKITRELSDKKIKYNTKYYKGLGGFDAEELAETTMDKDNRRMIQVTMQDVVNAKEMLEIYFRDDTINKRKDFILENGATYFNPHNI